MASPFDKLKNMKNPSKEDSSSNSSTEHNSQQGQTQYPEQNISSNNHNNPTKSQSPTSSSAYSYGNSDVVRRSYDPEKVPTGIKGYDQLINGGYKKGSINLVTGITGTGKTVFGTQFISNGVTIFKDAGIFITFDETKESIIDNMKSVGYDLKTLEDQGSFAIASYSPEQLMKILSEGGGLLDNLMNKYKAKRVVIDSISSFLMLNTSAIAKRTMLMNFFKLLKKWNVTALLINESSPINSNDYDKDSQPLTFEVDSITQLYYMHDNLDSERKRMLEIYKMRGTHHFTKAFPYQITDQGIKVMLGNK